MPSSVDRRHFLSSAGLTALGVTPASSRLPRALAQSAVPPASTVETPVLSIGYLAYGPPRGFPLVLLHGFPDDARAWEGVAPPLASAGYRVLVPYLRGFGPTRFRESGAPRMAEQAAIGQDVIDFANALGLDRFAVAGYDWGGRAAAVAAIVEPDRIRAAVLVGGYTVQNTIDSAPASPEAERRAWYQWYFNTDRGRAGLAANRRALCRLLWKEWSPTWAFTDAHFDATAPSFDNPDFVEVVVHSYRHRHANAPGERRFAALEQRLAARPPIRIPTITLYGEADGVAPPSRQVTAAERAALPLLVARRVIPDVGHFMPRERPEVVSSAIVELLERTPAR